MTPELISSAASVNAALLPRKRFLNDSTRLTHGSDDHTSNGEVCLNPNDVEDSKAADANANTVDLIAVV
jgi:hypothetical protein